MDNFLKSLSKGALATLAITAGIIFFIINDPPHTVCDTQKAEIKKQLKEFLYTKTSNALTGETTNRFTYLSDHCKYTNTPGGCLELFVQLREFSRELDSVISDCRLVVAEMGSIKKTIWSSIELMAQLAWGAVPPNTYLTKYGWLSTADISLYCDLKRQAVAYYGRDSWESFREKMFKTLPEASKIDRGRAWEVMLLSTNCNSYR